jgi:signal transduction histidine kinase/DNA-binding response OmpR family regulator/ligand-binding sensor domain-containing protein
LTDAIYKDSKGYIWISTKYGLNRYDGYDFKLYTKGGHNLQRHLGLNRIDEDESGNLWLFYITGSRESLRHLETSTETFIDVFSPDKEVAVPVDTFFNNRLPFKASDVGHSKIADPKKRLWIGTKKGQLFLHRQNKFEKIFEEKGVQFYHVAVDNNDRIWVAWRENLLCINLEGEVLNRMPLEGTVKGLWVENDNTVWITTSKISPKTRILKFWKKPEESAHLEPFYLSESLDSLVEGKIRNRFIYRTGTNHWFLNETTDAPANNDFMVLDERGDKIIEIHRFFEKDFRAKFLNYFEESEQMWFTSVTGVLKVKVTKNPFQLIHQIPPVSDCRGIAEDENGNIYFLNRHIFKWNPRTQALSQLTSERATYSLVYYDSLLWASKRNDGGLFYDLKSGQELSVGKSDIVNPDYTTLKTKKEGLFLIGRKEGLHYLDIFKQAVTPFEKYNEFTELEKSAVYHLHQNQQGIWAATEKGIYLLSEEEGVLARFDKEAGAMPFDYIRHIYEDEENVFWLATQGGGIIKWQLNMKQPASSEFQQFTTANSLSNDYIYAIYEDDYNKLWFSSDRGLMCMDKQTFEVKTFLEEDGLPHNEFNLTAHFKASDGTLYFGGLGGLISFHPSVFANESKNENQAPLQIQSFGILEADAEGLTDQTEQLKKSRKIILNPSDKLFEMRFVLMDFDKKENHRYAYQIEGYDDRWQFMENNVLRINSLPYGNYLLKVKAQNVNKGWSKEELELLVCILKPFYLRWWFILASILAVFGTIFAVVRRREIVLKRDRQRLEEEVRKRTQKIEEDKKIIEKDKAVIEKQAEELKTLDKAKTRFFSNITHEFRTPLTLVIGPLEQMTDESSLPVIFKRRMKGVLKNARHLLTLINQLLDLSKIESGNMQTEVTRGDIIGYTRELVNRFQVLAKNKKQQLNFVSPRDKWETHFDKNKWDKIIYNLVSNALKFTAEGENIQVSLVKLKKEGQDFIRLDVRDNGVGIAKKNLSQIFNRFYQVDGSSTRTAGGTGIGLALVKELVELQGGEIWVSSEVAKGTTFEIYLPVLKTENAVPLTSEPPLELELPVLPKEEKSTAFTAILNTEEQQKLELLIIEDNEEMRDYIRYCLDDSKYNITEAENGEIGVKKAQTLIPDLIISDVMMPKMNGFEVTTEIRKNISTSHIPLILLTAKASLESRLEGLERGADAYLTKPFSPQELAVRIQKLIALRQLMQTRYQNGIPEYQNGKEEFQKEDEFIIELRHYILDNIEETDLSGDRLGKHFGMSRVHLYRKLKALTNQSISEIVRATRLKKAVELLKEGEFNVSEITYQTGFSSVQHFSRTFKKEFGKSPSEFRNIQM